MSAIFTAATFLVILCLFGLVQRTGRALERQRAAWWASRPHACRWVATRTDMYAVAGGLATMVTEECWRCGQVRSEVRSGRWAFTRFGELVAVQERTWEAEVERLDDMWRRS